MTDKRNGVWRTLILTSTLVFAANLAHAQTIGSPGTIRPGGGVAATPIQIPRTVGGSPGTIRPGGGVAATPIQIPRTADGGPVPGGPGGGPPAKLSPRE